MAERRDRQTKFCQGTKHFCKHVILLIKVSLLSKSIHKLWCEICLLILYVCFISVLWFPSHIGWCPCCLEVVHHKWQFRPTLVEIDLVVSWGRFYKYKIAHREGTGYEYDGNVFVAWVLQVRRVEVLTKWSTGFRTWTPILRKLITYYHRYHRIP